MAQQTLIQKEKGSYILILIIKDTEILRIGKLGEFCFPKGFYAYVGSAMGSGGIAGRVNRHLSVTTNQHWHIDYLKSKVEIIEVWSKKSQNRLEHEWATAISKNKAAKLLAKGFGSSDCQCDTHLYHFNERPRFNAFKKLFSPKNKPEQFIKLNRSGKGERS